MMAVGVPEIAPVEESNERPAGREGETDLHARSATGRWGPVVMAVPFVRVKEFGVNVKEDGATSLTTMVTSAVVLPPVLLAATVRSLTR